MATICIFGDGRIHIEPLVLLETPGLDGVHGVVLEPLEEAHKVGDYSGLPARTEQLKDNDIVLAFKTEESALVLIDRIQACIESIHASITTKKRVSYE